MKTPLPFAASLLAALFLIGCATGQMNWDTEVGHLTYDQAVDKFGPPDQKIKSANGQTVAEWISRFPVASTGINNDFRYRSASFGSDMAGPGTYESKLRLTFDTNNVLATWSKE